MINAPKHFKHLMRSSLRWLALFVVLSTPVCLAETNVEVRLFDTVPASSIQTVHITGSFRIRGSSYPMTNALTVTARNNAILIQTPSGKSIGTRQETTLLPTGNGICLKANASIKRPATRRCYAGSIALLPGRSNTLNVYNTVSRQDYLTSVLASETPQGWPFEALKAQAVLSQTRLSRSPIKKRPSGETYIPVSDSTTNEAYLGIRDNKLASGALKATWGQRLTYDNRPIQAFYHSACGGHTSHDGYFSGNKLAKHPYSQGIRCPYCIQSPFHQEHIATVPLSQWKTAFPNTITLNTPDSGKRYTQATIGTKNQSAYSFWLALGQRFGWDKAPGTLFSIQTDKRQVIIRSRGAGHGVGLCQWGAAGMARQGRTYREILRFYYPKAALQTQ